MVMRILKALDPANTVVGTYNVTDDSLTRIPIATAFPGLTPGVTYNFIMETPETAGYVAPNVFAIDGLTAAFAYGLRRLRSLYTGPLIRVRRSSDNAQQDIGYGANNKLDTTALLAFAGAGSAFIVTWYDQSGNGRNMGQSTAGAQPRIVNAGVMEQNGGRNALFFDGTDDVLFNTTPVMYAAGAATLMAICAIDPVTTSTNHRLYGESSSTDTDLPEYIMFMTERGFGGDVSNDSASFIRNDAGTVNLNAGVSNRLLMDVLTNTPLYSIAVRDSGSSISHFFNGFVGTPRAYTRSGVLTFDRAVIGTRLAPTAAPFLRGHIAEIIGFPSLMSPADMDYVATNQEGEYGISVASFLSPSERLALINGTGDNGPSLAVNLGGGADDFDPIYLDRARGARRWLNGNNFDQVPDANLTPERWLASLPAGQTQTRFFFSAYDRNSSSKVTQGPDYSGRFQFKILQGAVSAAGFSNAGTNVVQIDANTWEFDCAWSGNLWVQLTPTAFPLHVSLIKTSDIAAVTAGETFTTDYKNQFVVGSTVRLLNMFATNVPTSGLTALNDRGSWSNWPQSSWQNGRPLAPMVAIFNEKMTSPWFCVHHNADDNHITQLATYLRDNLNPALKIRFELSNELWNTGTFRQGEYFKGLAESVWGVPNGYADSLWIHYAGKRFVQMMNIINGVFAGQTHRVIGVLAGQADGSAGNLAMLDALSWQTYEPGSYVRPCTLAKEYSIAPYINYTGVKATTAQAIKDQLDISVTAAANYIKTTMTQAGLVQAKAWIDTAAILAANRDLRLTIYEYNNHFDLFYYEGTVLYTSPGNPVAGALDAFIQATHSQEMAGAQDELRTYAKAQGVSVMAFFQDLGPATRFGTWGAKAHHQHNSVIWNDLVSWHTANPRWWAQ